MSDLMEAIEEARDGLLRATVALERNDEQGACVALTAAAGRLRQAIDALKEDRA